MMYIPLIEAGAFQMLSAQGPAADGISRDVVSGLRRFGKLARDLWSGANLLRLGMPLLLTDLPQ